MGSQLRFAGNDYGKLYFKINKKENNEKRF